MATAAGGGVVTSAVAAAAAPSAAVASVAAVASTSTAFGSAADVGKRVITGMTPLLKSADSKLNNLHESHRLLTETLEGTPGLADTRAYAFGGSTVFGMQERGSDVDFVLLGGNEIRDGTGGDASDSRANAFQAHRLRTMSAALRKRHFDWKIEEVTRARVPVIKVRTPSLLFDVTSSRRNGVRNSWLLRSYFSQRPTEARWLAMAVKHWSKQTGMNGPHGFLTSYAFNLLVVFYFIQRQRMTFVPLESADVSKVAEIPSGISLKKPPAEQFGRTCLDFLHFYSKEFDWETNVVTLSRPGVTTREQVGWTSAAEELQWINDGGAAKTSYRCCVEDPYEVNLNVGRNVTPFKMQTLLQTFERAQHDALGWLPDH